MSELDVRVPQDRIVVYPDKEDTRKLEITVSNNSDETLEITVEVSDFPNGVVCHTFGSEDQEQFRDSVELDPSRIHSVDLEFSNNVRNEEGPEGQSMKVTVSSSDEVVFEKDVTMDVYSESYDESQLSKL